MTTVVDGSVTVTGTITNLIPHTTHGLPWTEATLTDTSGRVVTVHAYPLVHLLCRKHLTPGATLHITGLPQPTNPCAIVATNIRPAT